MVLENIVPVHALIPEAGFLAIVKNNYVVKLNGSNVYIIKAKGSGNHMKGYLNTQQIIFSINSIGKRVRIRVEEINDSL